jgi:ABC-type Mn2+/Zn2+ transport system ATPase subunit
MEAPVKPGDDTLIRFEHVALGYGGGAVLDDVSFTIERGDFTGVIGPNGSGKTTILRAVLGSLKPLRGRISVSPGIRFGYVIQRQSLDPLFPLSVAEVVEMGRYPRLSVTRSLGRGDREAVERSLEMVGMDEMRGLPFRDLSGGQKQRALLARALAAEPNVMLLDEPTNDLDVSGETRIMDLIHEIHHKRGITVVIVSHLLHVVLNHVDRLMFLRSGSLSIHPIEEVLERGFLSNLYGVGVSVNVVNGKRYIVLE